MNELKSILDRVGAGGLTPDQAEKLVNDYLYTDLGYAKVDNIREKRTGYPEVVYCEGKTASQVKGIMEQMYERGTNILGTRAASPLYEDIRKCFPEAVYNDLGRVIMIKRQPIVETESYIAMVSAGTSDLPVLEEACETACFFGNKVVKITDVGVAGIHRLMDKLALLRGAKVLVVCAGMEGALPSVIAGLVDKPVIAVPTSVGYGASFGGVACLLAMLNSCAGGVSVVNIDNGFGAAIQAGMINRL